MSFERYFHDHPESSYWQRSCTCQSTSQHHTQGCPLYDYHSMHNHNASSGWMHQAYPSHPTPHSHPQSHPVTQTSTQTCYTSLSHRIRLKIPPYLQPGNSNPPTLALGGAVLPAGLFSGSEDMRAEGASRYMNNGLTTTVFDGDRTSYHQLNTPPYPVSVIESGHFDYNTQTQGSLQPSSTATIGIIDSQHPFTPAQSAALGGTGAVDTHMAIPLPSLSHPFSPSLSPSSVPSLGTLPLPIYSSSGLDLLAIFACIVSRPNPLISLGPVDLSSSFVVVDSRHDDQPIIYCSPGFCTLTGYDEQEVLRRNCRFLQNPQGRQEKGKWRRWTSNEAIGYLRKCLSGDAGGVDEGAGSDTFAIDKETGRGSGGRECQISITNYRKGGEAFMNLVTIIPIIQDGKVMYHVGFQADLGEQSTEISKNMNNGASFFMPEHSQPSSLPHSLSSTQRHSTSISTLTSNSSGRMFVQGERGGFGSRQNMISTPCTSRDFKVLIEDPAFMKKYPVGDVGINNEASSFSHPSTNPNPNHSFPSTNPSNMSPDPHTLGLVAPKHASRTGIKTQKQNHPLSLLLLSYIPDFILVVSLKGTFLYVSPSVKRVLGWEPEDLIGGSSGLDSSSLGDLDSLGMKSGVSVGESGTEGAEANALGLADICHPGDIMPLLRELKESTTTRLSNPDRLYHQGDGTNDPGGDRWDEGVGKPRLVDLLFRARVKPSHISSSYSSIANTNSSRSYASSSHNTPKYVWVECRGRIHVEPGKGRKVIILCGRAKEVMDLSWGKVEYAGGVSAPVVQPVCLSPRKPVPDGRLTSESGMRMWDMGAGKRENSRAMKGKYRAEAELQTEFWGTLTHSSGSLLVVGKGVRDVLGWEPSELVGKQIFQYIVNDQLDNESVMGEENGLGGLRVGANRLGRGGLDNGAYRLRMRQKVHDELKGMAFNTAGRRVKAGIEELPRRILCRMIGQSTSLSSASATSVQGIGMRKNGEQILDGTIAVNVELILYPSAADSDVLDSKQTISPAPIIYQIKLVSSPPYLKALTPGRRPKTSISHPLSESLFVELEVSRRSSWQYELQHLRYTNEKLREEIKEIEAKDRNQGRKVVNRVQRHKKTTTMGMELQEIERRQIYRGMEDSMLDSAPLLSLVIPTQSIQRTHTTPTIQERRRWRRNQIQMMRKKQRSSSPLELQEQALTQGQYANPAACTMVPSTHSSGSRINPQLHHQGFDDTSRTPTSTSASTMYFPASTSTSTRSSIPTEISMSTPLVASSSRLARAGAIQRYPQNDNANIQTNVPMSMRMSMSSSFLYR